MATKLKLGRRRLYEKSDPVLRVRLTPALKRWLEAEADKANRSVAGHARYLLLTLSGQNGGDET